MVLQSQKTGCVWKTPFRKFGHKLLAKLAKIMREEIFESANIQVIFHPNESAYFSESP